MKTPSECPVCHHAVLHKLGCDGTFEAWRCAKCEAAFAWPFPSNEELAIAYADPAYFGGGLRGGYRDYDEQTAPVLHILEAKLRALHVSGKTQSILDYGCGYGAHLKLAAELGWQCFGVEISDHARAVAQERLGNRALLGKSISDLIPHCYDLVVFLDVIEHLPQPRQVFYELFRSGCVGPKTQIVVTTPNGLCREARRDLLAWQYFHPPYHLIYYSAASLALFFQELRFTSIQLTGIHPSGSPRTAHAGSDGFPGAFNLSFTEAGGLLCEAHGSDFHGFMQERYIPGTWSALSTWEHVPRYLFAQEWARGKRVLDFGSGSGYGTALLASVASNVVGLDINPEALAWARSHHTHPVLTFVHPDDLATKTTEAFDLITCFEVIEHLKQSDQEALVEQLASRLTRDGRLLISTPNPLVTAKYGENPYHLHELDLNSFIQLLGRHFDHLQVLHQNVHTAISFGTDQTPTTASLRRFASDQAASGVPSVCWLAVCAQTPSPDPTASACYLDTSADPIGQFIDASHQLNLARLEAFNLREQTFVQQTRIGQIEADSASTIKVLGEELVQVRAMADTVVTFRSALDALAIAHAGQIEGHVREIDVLSKQKSELSGEFEAAQAKIAALVATIEQLRAEHYQVLVATNDGHAKAIAQFHQQIVDTIALHRSVLEALSGQHSREVDALATHHGRELAHVVQEKSELSAALGSARVEIMAHRAAIDQSRTEHRQNLENVSAENARKLAILSDQNVSLVQTLERMESSIVWRLARPLRWLVGAGAVIPRNPGHL